MKSALIPLFCQCAMKAARELGTAERADLLDLAADILKEHAHPALSEAAKALALDLRDSEASQLHFDTLLSAASKVNIVQ